MVNISNKICHKLLQFDIKAFSQELKIFENYRVDVTKCSWLLIRRLLMHENWRKCGHRKKTKSHKTSELYLFPIFRKLKTFEFICT